MTTSLGMEGGKRSDYLRGNHFSSKGHSPFFFNLFKVCETKKVVGNFLSLQNSIGANC